MIRLNSSVGVFVAFIYPTKINYYENEKCNSSRTRGGSAGILQ
jgi:hypothetical protein